MSDSTFARAQELHAGGRLDEALQLYEQCLREAPQDWRALTRLGLLHVQQRRYDVAVQHLERAIALKPSNAEAHAWLGEARRNEGRLDDARRALEEATRIQPDFAAAWFNLGLALGQGGALGEAIEAFERFRALRPEDDRVRRELAALHLQRGIGFDRQARLPSAIAAYQRAAALAPDNAEIHNALAVAHHNFAQHEEALAHYRRALEAAPDHAEVHSNLLMALHYVDPDDSDAMYRAHLDWAARHVSGITPAARESFANDRDPDRRLRIGYVSPRLSAGPVTHNFLPLAQAHDHEAFHVTCYSTSSVADAVTEEIRSHAGAWREAWALDDAALADQIRRDAIDILVDLSGHCPGHRLRLFARRAAPVQLTWLDYSNTTGLAAMDYFVGDFLQTPPDSPQRYTEHVLRLPDVRLAYRPPALPDVGPPPALSKGYVTFGCINRLSKLNGRVIATWSEILRAVPGSRLLLKGTAYASEEVRDDVARRFAEHGIAKERLVLRGPSPEARMMAEYGDIDIALDPFPYNGSTTTCDALAMGVPVVTLAGESIVSRAGLMFLTACGMEEWIAHDTVGYVNIAVEAGRDVNPLADLRTALRARFLASPACDAPRFARAFEAACREAWRRFVAEG